MFISKLYDAFKPFVDVLKNVGVGSSYIMPTIFF